MGMLLPLIILYLMVSVVAQNESSCCEVWSQWGDWAECVCETQRQTKYQYCEKGCGAWVGRWRTCSQQICVNESQTVGVWSEWGPCSVTCDTGFRFRYCLGESCGQRRIDQGECVAPVLCPGNCCSNWGQWSPWTECRPSCRLGNKLRSRTCNLQTCFKLEWQHFPCDEQECQSKSRWKPWGAWGACSATCGEGTRRRTRACDGDDCQGSSVDIDICNAGACQDCCSVWHAWGPTGQCSCETLRENRYRYCQDGCRKLENQWSPCTQENCVKEAQIAPVWSEWGPCSATCEAGFRQRFCLSDGCLYRMVDYEDCVAPVLCPGRCCSNWGTWSRWSTCIPTCRFGRKRRMRSCDMDTCNLRGIQEIPCDQLDCLTQHIPTTLPSSTLLFRGKIRVTQEVTSASTLRDKEQTTSKGTNQWFEGTASSFTTSPNDTAGLTKRLTRTTSSPSGSSKSPNNDSSGPSEQPESLVQCECPVGSLAYHQFRCKCLAYIDMQLPWQRARAYCQARGGDLVKITSAEENALYGSLASSHLVWIGLNARLKEGDFRGPDGSKPNYTNWAPGQPDGIQTSPVPTNCVELQLPSLLWNDISCSNFLPFICETTAS